MDSAAFAAEAAVEETHWWFVGRRELFASEIRRLGLPADAAVLDVGTSTGTNLRMLIDMGFRFIHGLDASDEAIQWCAQKGLPSVTQGDVCQLPFENESFDLILATDVIEHVDDDRGAMREINRVLRPGGHVLLTVPMFPSLWGLQDEVAHHKRRYRMGPFLELISATGLERVRHYHFNFILFVPIWLARRLMAILAKQLASENEINSPVINKLFLFIFRIDLALAPRLHVPFGVSGLALARKRGDLK